MGKLTRRAGRPMGKKILEGRLPTGAAGICARARAAKQKGSHMGLELDSAALRGGQLCRLHKKSAISGKKIVQFDDAILFDFF